MADTKNGNNLEALQAELRALDSELFHVDGKKLRASQCYRLETDPAHVMFNTNCPDSLKSKVEAILDKYVRDHEGGA